MLMCNNCCDNSVFLSMQWNEPDLRKYDFGPLKEKSGFYTLIEDELFGPGKRYIYEPAYGLAKPATVIRNFGTIWDSPIKVRMYLYTPTPNFQQLNLDILENSIKSTLTDKMIDDLPAPYLQHNFADADGNVKDQVRFWKFGGNEIMFTPTIRCIKLAQEIHVQRTPANPSQYDIHVSIDDCV